MRLHQDVNAFRVLIEDIHNRTGYREDVIEKDYYVVLILSELAKMQNEGLPAYFKGGTALYKALKTTNRFSEDIDLSVDTRGCSNAQNNKRLENATKKYTSLPRDRSQSVTNRSEVIAVYTYEPVTTYDIGDSLQRFGKLKIEATSFTISEPVDDLEITPIVYDFATEEQKKVLVENYGVVPFTVKAMTIERIFVDKLFAAEAYVRMSHISHRAFEAAKHIYDLVILKDHPKIKALYENEELLDSLLKIRIVEEQERLDGIPGVLPADFSFFDDASTSSEVKAAYDVMQRQYVFKDSDCIKYDDAMDALTEISARLRENVAWMRVGFTEGERL